MMGQDCERMVGGISAVIDALSSGMASLGAASAYRITTVGEHGEAEVGHPASGFVTAAVAAMGQLSPDVSKMKELDDGLFIGKSSFNNSNGSPWTEFASLKAAIDALPGADNVQWMGDRVNLLSLMTVALGRAVDAKYAMITYHDYVQRGYDNKFNGNVPSITFEAGLGKESVGNVRQEYDENVNIPKESIDPF